jgi:hypothetical protein
MPPMPAAPPKLRRPPGKAWGLILAGIGVLLFILAVQVAGDRMNPEEKAEDVPAGSPLVQDNAAAILPTRPASSPAEPTPQAVLPILGQTPSAPLNPVSAEERGKAEGYFASGASVYLYDPQPPSTELSVLESTLFSARYILAKDSESIPNVVFIWKVNPAGDKEYVVSDRGYIEDWGNETGQITFSVFNILRDTNRQNMAYDPNQAVLQGMLGMSTLYGPMNESYVDDPIYLDVFLMAPEAQEGTYLLSDAAVPLSNAIKFEITP